jgi:ribosomal-protein-alanine N-acetyltransferase
VDVPTLLTERLRLEALAAGHSDGMFALWSSPDVCRYSGPLTDCDGKVLPSPVHSRADSDKILDYWIAAQRDGWGFRWALLLRESGEFAGTAGFNSLGACSEYAYHLHPRHWHQGLMSEATAAAFEWIAESCCTELEALIARDNVNSISFAERWGFRRTGTAPGEVLRFRRNIRLSVG